MLVNFQGGSNNVFRDLFVNQFHLIPLFPISYVSSVYSCAFKTQRGRAWRAAREDGQLLLNPLRAFVSPWLILLFVAPLIFHHRVTEARRMRRRRLQPPKVRRLERKHLQSIPPARAFEGTEFTD